MSKDFVLHFDPESDVLRAARECEAAVFLDQYGNSSQQWDEEYGPYDDTSAFLAITEPGGDAVAAMRVILPSVIGLKTLADVARPPWSIDGHRAARAAGMSIEHTWDVATIAVRNGAGNGGLLSAALYHGLFRAVRANTARWIVMILDARAQRLLNAVDIRTTRLPGTVGGPYLGSASSAPLWGEMAAMADHQRTVNPDAHRLINLGVGLDGVSLPAPAQFVLAPCHAVAPPAILSGGRVSA
ncbi:MAG: hypothetical protein ACRDVG_09030 [Jatrophihabitantaceae bacterium]